MPELPKVEICDAHPLATARLRHGEFFRRVDPHFDIPDVVMATGAPNPFDRPHRDAIRVGIDNIAHQRVGAFNLVQKRERTWINDVRVETPGQKVGLAVYLGVIVLLDEVGRTLESDPAGLSDQSNFLWESLVRRGVARAVPEAVDQHGYPRFLSQIR